VKLQDEIDNLFKLPLKDFTPARNALAKQAGGAEATEIKSLQKPSVPAWAVNQLYWKSRGTYDALIKAAESLRAAHRGLLAGKAADVHTAEADHRDRVRTAMQDIRRLLAEAGETASEQTLMAASETLEALPSQDEAPGRLTRPLKRMGFEALAGVAPRAAGAAPPKLMLVKSRAAKAPAEPEVSPAKKREIEEIEKRLGDAVAEERQAKADAERGRRELERAERDRARAEEELAAATAKVERLESEVAAHEKSLRALAAEQEKLEKRLEKLR
jgi:septal ring factor EnvC (AmiA/AmiB activator)